MKNRMSAIGCLVVCSALLLPVFADAAPVKINPGRFQGRWRVGTSSMKTGPETLDLLPGQEYRLKLEQVGDVPFTVLADGTVSSNRPESATGSGKTLTLKTVPVLVKPGPFSAAWHIPSISKSRVGPAKVALVPGLTYDLSFGSMGGFRFMVLDSGVVRSHQPASARGTGNTLAFNTTPVTINTGPFSASWYISNISRPHQGSDKLNLMPGLTYDLFISNIGGFQFSVSENGSVNSLNPESAQGSGNTLAFKTTSIGIDPSDFLGAWMVLHISKPLFGTGRIDLIPGLTYSLSIKRIGDFQFDVRPDGTIHSRHPESAKGSGEILVFKTTSIKIDPGASSKSWVIPWIPTGPNPSTVDLIPGLTYTLLSKGKRGKFMLGGPCTVIPSTLILNQSTFNLDCLKNLNKPPTADSGPDQKAPLGKQTILDGSHSFDPDGDPIVSYQWSIDSTPVGSKELLVGANGAKPKFTPDKIGSYLFSLKVNDGKLNSPVDTIRLFVTENRAPVANISASPTSGLASLKVWFDATASSDPDGGSLDYAWNFGDPGSGVDNFSVLGLLNHVYHNAGHYTAILTVRDNLGKRSVTTFDVNVEGPDLPPTAVPVSSPVSHKNPLTVQFTSNAIDPEGGKLSYRWDFGDGSETSTVANPLHQYAVGGSYNVLLVVSDGTHTLEVVSGAKVASPIGIGIQEAKVTFGKRGKARDKIILNIGFAPNRQIQDGDLIKVAFDKDTLFEIPFGQFIEMQDTPGKFTYKAKNLKVKMDIKKGLLQVVRQKMNLKSADERKKIELIVVFGQVVGVEYVHYNGTTLVNQKLTAEVSP